ncbi:MAG: glycosyltransferase N-terminal domain-containing protein [Paracoccus sp. (in: a-proteobacteria)]|nr:glycosyltransferase N-terminal domain-containing protein [Paracoccus sp. (in: a-proteobacteria)]
MAGGWLGWLKGEAPAQPAPAFDLPPGDAPLIWLRAGAGFCPATEGGAPPAAVLQLLGALRRQGFRVALSCAGGTACTLPAIPRGRAVTAATIAEPPDTAPAAAAHLDALRPAALLMIGPDLPARLIEAAHDRQIPVIMAEARLPPPPRRLLPWPSPASRAVMSRLTRILVTDPASRKAMLALGADDDRIEVSGPITQMRDPLRYLEAEREALTEAMVARDIWLAACFTPGEEQAVTEAHLAALSYSHRALLLALPADPAGHDAMAARMEEAGLIVAQRALDEDTTPEVNVYLCDDPAELGLFYRLAPVAFMGGTLDANGAAARHPFEPAALGSAIIHGPDTAAHPAEWQQLDGAGAARRVSDAAGLAQAVSDLFGPDQAAELAANAWAVSTGGAGVAARIAIVVKAALRGIEETAA